MDSLYQIYVDCGWSYCFLLVGSFTAGLIYLVLTWMRPRSKRSRLIPVLVALLPFAIGLFGTFDAYREIDAVVSTSGVVPSVEEQATANRIARTTTYVGAVFSFVLLMLAAAAVLPCCCTGARSDDDAQIS